MLACLACLTSAVTCQLSGVSVSSQVNAASFSSTVTHLNMADTDTVREVIGRGEWSTQVKQCVVVKRLPQQFHSMAKIMQGESADL